MNTPIKPSVFIASSVEGLQVADAINANLEHHAHCTLWRNGTFKLSSQTIDDLVKKSSAVDFAVFAFTPDDLATIRKREEQIPRDNVVFEMGLFIGAIGKDRCYLVRPRGIEMHLPSDLLGVNAADYAVDRPDGDVASALNYACSKIKDRIQEIGVINRTPHIVGANTSSYVPNPPNYQLGDADLIFLAECVKNHVNGPIGSSFNEISRQIPEHTDHSLALSAIKLERLGHITKTIEQGYNGEYEYFAFSATDSGIDIFLKHESRVSKLVGNSSPAPRQRAKTKLNDDIPF